eukprot:snap_masked-scaffold_7-processed-gene-19.54-mRNA-1 protein AED:1.00 eAED:1.00 QI:0/0/0/0/1/1/3/0/787
MGKDSKDKLKWTIPVLRGKVNFRDWERAILTYLNGKSLAYLMFYETSPPNQLLNRIGADSIDEEKNTKIQEKLQNVSKDDSVFRLLQGLPVHTLDILVEMERVWLYDRASSDIPSELLKVSLSCSLTVVTKRQEDDETKGLITLHTTTEKYDNARIDHHQNCSKVMSILRGSLTNDDKHLVDTSSGVMEAYKKIKELYVEDLELESFSLLSKMESLKCKEMDEYIKKFKKLLTKFTSIGELYRCNTEYFQDITDRDFSFNNVTRTTNSSSKRFSNLSKLNINEIERRQLKSPAKKSKRTKSTKVNLLATKEMRCSVCSVFGHKAQECPTTERRCGLCGAKNHLARECKSKKKVSLAVLAAVLAKEEDDEYEEEEESDEESEVESKEDTSDVEEVSLGALRCSSISSKTENNETSNIICHSATTSEDVCSCYLSTTCLRILLDSGARKHITGVNSLLQNTKQGTTIAVTNAFEKTVYDSVYGNLKVTLLNNTVMEFPEVLYCPNVSGTILSIGQLSTQGFTATFLQNLCEIRYKKVKVLNVKADGNCFYLHCRPHKPNDKRIPVNVLYAKSAESLLQHYRFGHVSGNTLSRLGYKFDTNARTVCGESQIRTDPHKKKISKTGSSSFVAVTCGEKLCCDTIGPFTPRDIHKNRYAFIVIDSFSRFSWVFPVKSKEVVKAKLFSLIERLTKQHKTVKCVMSDQGSEFKNTATTRFLDERGIIQQFSADYHQSENGRVERLVQTLKQTSRNLLLAETVPGKLWSYALLYAVRIWNAIPKAGENKSPLEYFQ